MRHRLAPHQKFYERGVSGSYFGGLTRIFKARLIRGQLPSFLLLIYPLLTFANCEKSEYTADMSSNDTYQTPLASRYASM
jgi:hypothetical protein